MLHVPQALALVDTAFMPGADKHTVKLVLRRLRAGAGRSHPSAVEALGTLARPKVRLLAIPCCTAWGSVFVRLVPEAEVLQAELWCHACVCQCVTMRY